MVDNDQDKSTYRLVASVSKTMGDSLPQNAQVTSIFLQRKK